VKSSEKACAFTGKKARRGAGGAAPAASAASVYQLSCQPPRALGAPGTLFRPVSLERSPAVVLWRAPTPPGPLGPLACLARDREGSSPASGTRVRAMADDGTVLCIGVRSSTACAPARISPGVTFNRPCLARSAGPRWQRRNTVCPSSRPGLESASSTASQLLVRLSFPNCHSRHADSPAGCAG
jgi:hypothetical protein